MPRSYSSMDKIRAELAWVTDTPDPNKCGCRNLRCCEETGHNPGECAGVVATKFWTFRWGRTTAPLAGSTSWCGSKRLGETFASNSIASRQKSMAVCPER